MKVFIIDANKITKYLLPAKASDNFSISYSNNEIDCLITFKEINDSWHIISNGTVNIIENGEEIHNQVLEMYHKYKLRIVEKNVDIEIFSLPAKEKLFKLSFQNLSNISIGSNRKCNISYNDSLVADVQAVLKLVGDDWIISAINDKNYKVFINNVLVGVRKLKVGDVIFIEGIKVIWMNNYLYVNNPSGLLKITGMSLAKEDNYSYDLLPVKEEDKYVSLYSKEDYFAHYPTIREKLIKKENQIDAPPTKEQDNNMPFILTMSSSLVMGGSAFAMGYNIFNNLSAGKPIKSMIPQLVMCSTMIFGSLIMPRISSLYQKSRKKKKEEKRQEKYSEYLNTKEREINIEIKDTLQILNDNYPTCDGCLVAITQKNRNFWWRQYKDDEFLTVRLGFGKLDSNLEIKSPERHFTLDEDNLLEDAINLKEKYKYVNNAPIFLSLRKYPVTSLVCENENKLKYIRELIIQLITLHSSEDLKIVLFSNESNSYFWEFLKYVPHAFSSDKSIRFYGTNTKEIKYVSNYLEEVFKERKEVAGDNKDFVPKPYYLIITDDYKNNGNTQIIDDILSKDARAYGFSLLILDDSIKQVPANGDAFIEVGLKDGVVIAAHSGLNSQKVFYLDNNTSEYDMMDIALKLADIPVLTKNGASVLPTSLKFLDMFNVSRIEQLNILNRWQENNPVHSLDTVVGVHPNGDKFKLDLHEKYHGPHGLIAGSTGSGKSEFIITYILSLCINYHPYEVQFVLIDYKGGGLAGAFENKEAGIKIPHLVGTITNLDNSSLNRSLVSIQSELKRRQKVFNEVRESLGEGTIDIYKYQRLYREGVVKVPMSHLFIICDEFAELKQQQPDFMAQLISISRIGRSLGVHLILATQKPSGVVNDQIWANSRFKVCLKVQDKSDSQEMLKRPEAASIKETGRFYLQVGYDELFELGQSGWSGAKYVPSDKIQIPVDESINYINNVGFVEKSIKEEDKSLNDTKDYGDQLTNLVKYISDIGKKEKLVTKKLWLDAIPAEIFINDLKQKYGYNAQSYYINPVIGEYDDPENQNQQLLSLDLSKNGNALIYGIPGSGKENLITNIIRSTIVEHTPEEVNIYILDCGSESLRIFSGMPHVGGVVTIDEKERINDLFNMLKDEVERRKELLSEFAGNYNDYIANSGSKLPFIMTVINSYDIFQENYQILSDEVQSLFRDGAKYGVTFILSAISTSAVKTRSTAYFPNKICLKLSNDTDYKMILNSPRNLIPADIFGRGIIEINDGYYEFQTASFAQKSEVTNSLRELAKVLNDAYTIKATPIPSIPDVVMADSLINKVVSPKSTPIGFNYMNKHISYLEFKNDKIVPISFNDYDEVVNGFINGITYLLSSKARVRILDFMNVLKINLNNVTIYTKDFDRALDDLDFDLNLGVSKQESFLVITGMAKAVKKLAPKDYERLVKVLTEPNVRNHTHIIIIDSISSLKECKMESWFMSEVDLGNYLWIGEGLTNQMVLSVPNMSFEDKKIVFGYMAILVKSGKYEFVRHIVDGREVL